MASKTIKISEEKYHWLLAIATELQRKLGRKVSFDDALNELELKRERKSNIMKFAGAWKMSDKEWNEIRNNLNREWEKWKIQSV